MEYDDLELEVRGGAAIVWFNRPRQLNAFRNRTFDALHAVLDETARRPAVRSVILTGRGRAFCAGEDLGEMAAFGEGGYTVREGRHQLTRLQDLTRKLLAFPKAVIAAINGPAVGLGAELPLACPLRVASTEAWFLFPEARRGMLETNGAFHLLPRIVGAGRAAEWFLTARRVPAEEARAAGLVAAVVDPAELVTAAIDHAERTVEVR